MAARSLHSLSAGGNSRTNLETVGSAVFLDIASGRQLGALEGHGKSVTQVAFSSDGRLLASSGTDNTIKIRDVRIQRELRTLSDILLVSTQSTSAQTRACSRRPAMTARLSYGIQAQASTY